MKHRRRIGLGLVALLTCLLLGWWLWCRQLTTLLIVRHADRAGSADALGPEGVTRAGELLHALEKAGVTAIYRSDTNRARDTAAPLAAALGLSPNIYPARDASAAMEAMLGAHSGETVVVIGHSNTVPALIAAAGGPRLPDIDEHEFDELFLLTVCRCQRGEARLLHLQYGSASP